MGGEKRERGDRGGVVVLVSIVTLIMEIDVVASTIIHPSGGVLATASGSRTEGEVIAGESQNSDLSGDDSGSDASSSMSGSCSPVLSRSKRTHDSSLKVWSLY